MNYPLSLTAYGLSEYWLNKQVEQDFQDFTLGRVATEHRERYTVVTENGEYEAELIGSMRFTANSRDDFPAVGDWVAVSEYDSGKLLIHGILDRTAVLQRQAVGVQGQLQIIASNVDYAFILQALDRDFSINRLERYLAICNEAGVQTFIVLTKTDLIEAEELSDMLSKVRERVGQGKVYAISNSTGEGLEQISTLIYTGKTYCFLGSSGVGKSTLINKLAGNELMQTGEISDSVQRGKHVTTHRELILLPNGGVVIDNPGMREIGVANANEGIESTFETITELSENCRYADCTHLTEAGCAVIEAVDNGELDRQSYENYLKMQRESAHYSATVAEKRQKDKDFGKMVKQFKKKKDSGRYL